MVPQKPRGESFKEDVITELNALTDQLRKRLKTDSAAWIALVTLMSMIDQISGFSCHITTKYIFVGER